MGAGAGCDIEIKDCNVNSVGEINLQNATLEVDKWYVTITFDCDIKMDGTVRVSSYYHSTGDIEEVALTVNNISLALDFGNGNDDRILTPEAVDRFESQFDGDINSLWEDFIPILTVNDIDPNYLKDELRYGNNYDGTGSFGGGWVGSTFSGQMEIDDVDSHSGYNPISGYACSVDDEFVIDYIDKAKYGYNIEYTAFYNGEIFETYNELDEAIDALRKEILADPTDADLYDCYVESSYYYLRNGSVDGYEYESDFDYAQVEYRADSDPDYNFEAVAEVAEEIDDEFAVPIDEDFDI